MVIKIEALDNAYEKNLKRWDREEFGLRYVPSLEPGLSDTRDRHFDHTEIKPPGGMFSDRNEAALRAAMASLRPLDAILEIGCWGGSSRGHSSTNCLVDNKPKRCWYFGVDIADNGRREHIEDPYYRRVFIQEDSADRKRVRAMLPQLWRWDILFIDGRHSVAQVIADWSYAELLRSGGLVIMHDINYHPGPRLVFDAVDPDLFDKSSVCPHADDFGLGLLRRK